MQSLGLAHSKFILSGEHFVVDGSPSVVIPANCFSTQVSIKDKDSQGISATCILDSDSPESGSSKKEYESLVAELVYRASELLQIDISEAGIHVQVKSSIPPGQGAGSSSALCQAIVQAMLKHYFADDFHPNYLDWFGVQLENNWHGPVSGVDNAAVAYRSILKFQRYKSPEILRVPCPVFFVVGSTGPRTEINPYQIMRSLRENQPLQLAEYRRQMNENTKFLSEGLVRGDLLTVGACMNESHKIFSEIGIVTQKMADACRAAMNLGAFGARMTGAGGGGFVIACVPVNNTEAIVSKWRSMGLKSVRNLQFGLNTIE